MVPFVYLVLINETKRCVNISYYSLRTYRLDQCDQIGQFIGLRATFKSLWQQLICPNLPNFKSIFVNVSKSLIFLVKSF